ncbi:MAG: (deoxy)nucleoside triphosphate pyrophosphohydrolase [Deltaproteobacteria bacterium]|nr:(deoxy)nucleoside triphosphate pyrophosphohydrolase [Deltaproteobacteria bacterium]
MPESVKRTLRVVAAQIRDQNGNYLITQRLPHAALPLLWEFPGGKVEPGESDEAALVREIQEELDVVIEPTGPAASMVAEYERHVIDFHSFPARIVRGAPRRIGVWEFRWVSPADLGDYRFPPVDQAAIERLVGQWVA